MFALATGLARSTTTRVNHHYLVGAVGLVPVRTFATPAKPAAPAAAGGKAAPAKGAAAKGAAGKKKPGKESKMGNTLTAGSSGFAVGEKIPIAIFKEGQDPVVKQDKDYPEWLWKVHELPTLNDCIKIVAQDMEEGKVNVPLAKRINRLKRNARVKAYNASTM